MSIPFLVNSTFDLFRAGNGPPNPPDIAGVPGHLIPRYRNIKPNEDYDHILIVDVALDIRYTDGTGARPGDDIYFPDQNALTTGGSRMKVWFVEVFAKNTPYVHKAAYLRHDVVQYPTQDL